MVIRRAARFDERARRSAWLVWLAGVGVYFLAVLHRASLGVAGPQAVDRLGISATELGASCRTLPIERWCMPMGAISGLGSRQLVSSFSIMSAWLITQDTRFAAAAAAIGIEPDAILKTLLFAGDHGSYVVAIASGT